MTYKINSTDIIIQPTQGQWVPRKAIGDDGNGRPIYPAVREFEMRWQLMDASGTNQLQNFFDSVGSTGTSIVDLPQYGATSYTFNSYSGTVLREPEWSTFFNEHLTEVILRVTKIRT